MPKHPTSSRVPRPVEPEPDDKFLFAVERAASWAREHSRQLIIGGIVLAILVLAGVYYVDSQRRVEQEAAARLTELHQTIQTGNVPLAIRDLQTYLSTFGGTRAAREARLLLADLLLDQDRPADAVQALGRMPRSLDDPLGLAAAQLMAAAHEDLGQHAEAIEVYESIARDARFEFQRREALAAAARLALETGRAEQATDLYGRLVQTFEEGEPGRSYFEMWRSEAAARAATGAAPAAQAAPPAETPEDAAPGADAEAEAADG